MQNSMNPNIHGPAGRGCPAFQKGCYHGQVGACLETDDYYGFHRTATGWVYRVWAPDARQVYLTGEFNGWNRTGDPLLDLGNGNWVLYLCGADALWEKCRVETIVVD